MNDKYIAMQRLSMMGDWLKLNSFDNEKMNQEISQFENDWKKYNPRKENNRFGLSVTSLDGNLSGIPDLDSLYEFNMENAKSYDNQSFRQTTVVYQSSSSLRCALQPYEPWLGRSHFLKLNAGGFFPEHYDIDKTKFEKDEIRLIGFVRNTSPKHFKFCYEDSLLTNYSDGDLFYFNANKRHSVFAMENDVVLLVATLKFDEKLFETIIKNYDCI